MSGIFGSKPKTPTPLPVVLPSDVANRINSALARRLQAGGSNADQTSSQAAPTGGGHMPTLTGLN